MIEVYLLQVKYDSNAIDVSNIVKSHKNSDTKEGTSGQFETVSRTCSYKR